MTARLIHIYDGWSLARKQRQVQSTRAHLTRQRAEIDAAERWAAREAEQLALEIAFHQVRGRKWYVPSITGEAK
jgi:hypothetical protein